MVTRAATVATLILALSAAVGALATVLVTQAGHSGADAVWHSTPATELDDDGDWATAAPAYGTAREVDIPAFANAEVLAAHP